MSNESYENIQPEIKQMMEKYLLLRRQGKAPTIEKFIQQCPAEHQQALRKELEDYEQLHLLFSALQQYQAEKIAAELSEEQIKATHERFQQRVASTLHRNPVLAFIQRLKDYLKVWIASVRNFARGLQEVFLTPSSFIQRLKDYVEEWIASLRGRVQQSVFPEAITVGGTTVEVTFSPRGQIRETAPYLRVTFQRDTGGIVLKSVQILLFDSSGNLLLQTKTEDIMTKEGAEFFQIPLAGHVNLERGQHYRFEVYLDFEEDGTRKRRYLGDSVFKVD